MTDFEVRRDDLRQTRFVDGAGEGNVRIERFALTANNVTYGVMGDALSYWTFFPASEEGWGHIPVWGLGTVVETGQTVYGYLPMSSSVTMALDGELVDRSSHRSGLPGVYNRYLPLAADAERLDEMLLLRPLFGTSVALEDFLAGAEGTVVLGSASSKTAYGLAFLLAWAGRPVVGLTSQRNRGFVEALGVYDRVLAYDEAGSLSGEAVVYVDMSGDAGVREAVHAAADVRRSVVVGATHWEDVGSGGGGDEAPELFFAPTHLEAMTERLGAAGLRQRMGEAWSAFMGRVDDFMAIEHHSGPDALERLWRSLVDGDVDPRRGHVVTLGR